MPARVQHAGEQRRDAVEEDLRQDQVRQRRDQVFVGGRRVAGHKLGEQRRGGDGEHGRAGQEDRGQREQPLGVGLAAIPVLGTGLHQQRHDDAGQHAAEQQLVDHIRQRVGQVVGVSDRGRADRGAEDDRTHEASDATHHAAGGHDGAAAGDRRLFIGQRRRGYAGRSRRRPRWRSRRTRDDDRRRDTDRARRRTWPAGLTVAEWLVRVGGRIDRRQHLRPVLGIQLVSQISAAPEHRNDHRDVGPAGPVVRNDRQHHGRVRVIPVAVPPPVRRCHAPTLTGIRTVVAWH